MAEIVTIRQKKRANGKAREAGPAGHTKVVPVGVKFSDKDKAALFWLCRVKNMSQREVLEWALADKIRATRVGERGFEDYWDPHEGVYTMRLIADRAMTTSADEDKTREFTLMFWEFFYKDKAGINIRRENIVALWDRLGEFMQQSEEDFIGCGKAMVQHLKSKGIDPPKWPRG